MKGVLQLLVSPSSSPPRPLSSFSVSLEGVWVTSSVSSSPGVCVDLLDDTSGLGNVSLGRLGCELSCVGIGKVSGVVLEGVSCPVSGLLKRAYPDNIILKYFLHVN